MLVDKFPWLLQPTLPTILIRTLLALLCAGAIGYDRNVHGAAAGLRTHILVCVGAMLAIMTGQFAAIYYAGKIDVTRIGAQVVSGIGFLGAGSIIMTKSQHIQGLTTAAGLWASACIGLAIGIGFYEGAVVGTIAVYFTEHMLRRVSKSIVPAKKKQSYAAQTFNEDSDASE